MAQVTLDSSEYDMLRENKAKAEKEVEELKKIIKDLEEKSRVIVKTEILPFDIEAAAREFLRIRESLGIAYVSDSEMFKRLVEAGFGVSIDTLRKGNSSTQYIGFDDIEYKVRQDIQKREENSIEAIKKDYEHSRDSYNQKLQSLEERYQNKISNLETANCNLKDEIQALESDNKMLGDRLERVRKEKNAAVKNMNITKLTFYKVYNASLWQLLFHRDKLLKIEP